MNKNYINNFKKHPWFMKYNIWKCSPIKFCCYISGIHNIWMPFFLFVCLLLLLYAERADVSWLLEIFICSFNFGSTFLFTVFPLKCMSCYIFPLQTFARIKTDYLVYTLGSTVVVLYQILKVSTLKWTRPLVPRLRYASSWGSWYWSLNCIKKILWTFWNKVTVCF